MGLETDHRNPDPFLTLWSEKRTGQGEDAFPIAQATAPDGGAVAVFDGLGGAGSALVATAEGEQSQARVAARLAREIVLRFLAGAPPVTPADATAAGTLGEWLCAEFARTVDVLHLGAPSVLRSRLIRTLPTTLALARYARTPDGIHCEAIWAGDSRLYLFTPGDGLQQLSEDDLKSGADALANLNQDSPLDNLVSASDPFALHVRTVEVTDRPVLLLAASDGCFGYLPTPWHFEHLLLEALREGNDYAQFRDGLARRIDAVTGDDVSLGMAVIDADSFTGLKQRYGWRARAVTDLVWRVDEASHRLEDLRQQIAESEERSRELHLTQWNDYRSKFEQVVRAVPKRTVPAGNAADRRAGGSKREAG